MTGYNILIKSNYELDETLFTIENPTAVKPDMTSTSRKLHSKQRQRTQTGKINTNCQKQQANKCEISKLDGQIT